jgi:hypothetical protein
MLEQPRRLTAHDDYRNFVINKENRSRILSTKLVEIS